MNLNQLKPIDDVLSVLPREHLLHEEYLGEDYDHYIVSYTKGSRCVLVFHNRVTNEKVVHKTLYRRGNVDVSRGYFKEVKSYPNGTHSFLEPLAPFGLARRDLYGLFEWLKLMLRIEKEKGYVFRYDCHQQNFGYDLDYNLRMIDQDTVYRHDNLIESSHHAYGMMRPIHALMETGSYNHSLSRLYYHACSHVSTNYKNRETQTAEHLQAMLEVFETQWSSLFREDLVKKRLKDQYQGLRGFTLRGHDPSTIFGFKLDFLLKNCNQKETKTLLDIGCAGGGIIYHARRAGFVSCHGIESSEEALMRGNYAIHLDKSLDHCRIQYAVIFLDLLALLDTSDVVVVYAILHHLFTYEKSRNKELTPDVFMQRAARILYRIGREVFVETIHDKNVTDELIEKCMSEWFHLLSKEKGKDGRFLLHYVRRESNAVPL